jgi:spore coat-associated protein N
MLLAALAALVTAAGAAGLGTLASGYTNAASTTTGSIANGWVTIGAGTSQSLTTDITKLEPGDTAYRIVDLKNSSTTVLSSVTLSTTDSSSGSKLSTSGTGLQMLIDSCSVAWTPVVVVSPALTYSCAGSTTHPLTPSRDVLGTSISLSGLNATNGAIALPTTDHLRIALTLPPGSLNADQTAQSIITYTFTGTQPTTPTPR